MDSRTDRAAERQVLQPRALGFLLAPAALPVCDATTRTRRRPDLRHGAPCASMAGCGRHASIFLSGAPRHVHVAVPRPLKPCAAGLGLGETELDLWRQPLFPAGAAAARGIAADDSISAGTLGSTGNRDRRVLMAETRNSGRSVC